MLAQFDLLAKRDGHGTSRLLPLASTDWWTWYLAYDWKIQFMTEKLAPDAYWNPRPFSLKLLVDKKWDSPHAHLLLFVRVNFCMDKS